MRFRTVLDGCRTSLSTKHPRVGSKIGFRQGASRFSNSVASKMGTVYYYIRLLYAKDGDDGSELCILDIHKKARRLADAHASLHLLEPCYNSNDTQQRHTQSPHMPPFGLIAISCGCRTRW
jgi:hypothetical protein